MEYRYIDDETEIEGLFETPYNAPVLGNEFTEEEFDEEYWSVFDALRDRLSQAGSFSYSGEGDFCMNETRGAASRWISVVFTTDKMWNPSLLESVVLTLEQQTHDYMVNLSHEVFEHPLFHILVSKSGAMGYCDEPSFLKNLGFH